MPVTVATQVVVWPIAMEEGVATTLMPVTETGGGAPPLVIAMVADPETSVDPACVEFAVQVPVPAPDGVKTPACVIVPPAALHETAELKAPVPATFAVHFAVCEVVMEAGDTPTVILVTTGEQQQPQRRFRPSRISSDPVWQRPS